MRVITTDRGSVVSVRDVRDGPPRNSIETIDDMFQMHRGFAGWNKPVEDIKRTVLEAVAEYRVLYQKQRQAESETLNAYANKWFGARGLISLMGRKPSVPVEVPSEQELLSFYIQKFGSFKIWMKEKNTGSRLFSGHFTESIQTCARLIDALQQLERIG